jgi:hypothetical protein
VSARLSQNFFDLEEAHERLIIWKGFHSLVVEFNASFEGGDMLATDSVLVSIHREVGLAQHSLDNVRHVIASFGGPSHDSGGVLDDSELVQARARQFQLDREEHERSLKLQREQEELAPKRIDPVHPGWDGFADVLRGDGPTDDQHDEDEEAGVVRPQGRARGGSGLLRDWRVGATGRQTAAERRKQLREAGIDSESD